MWLSLIPLAVAQNPEDGDFAAPPMQTATPWHQTPQQQQSDPLSAQPAPGGGSCTVTGTVQVKNAGSYSGGRVADLQQDCHTQVVQRVALGFIGADQTTLRPELKRTPRPGEPQLEIGAAIIAKNWPSTGKTLTFGSGLKIAPTRAKS